MNFKDRNTLTLLRIRWEKKERLTSFDVPDVLTLIDELEAVQDELVATKRELLAIRKVSVEEAACVAQECLEKGSPEHVVSDIRTLAGATYGLSLVDLKVLESARKALRAVETDGNPISAPLELMAQVREALRLVGAALGSVGG